MMTSTTIVFFDGFCGLCNGAVDFLLARDKQKLLNFSPLQGETAKRYLTPSEIYDLDSVVVVSLENPEAPVKLKRSTAVLFALSKLSPNWRFVSQLFLQVPGFIRDLVYKRIARNRFYIFGRRETCRIPTPEEFGRFLP